MSQFIKIYTSISLAVLLSAGLAFGQNTRSKTEVIPSSKPASTLSSPENRVEVKEVKEVKKRIRSRLNANGGLFAPDWVEDLQASSKVDINKMYAAPMFRQGSLDNELVNLSYYEHYVPVAVNQDIEVRSVSPQNVEDFETKAFKESAKEASADLFEGGWYPQSNVVLGPRVIRQKQHYRIVKIYPVRVDASGNAEKAETVKFELGRIFREVPAVESKSAKTATTSSVLADGQWYKIGVTEEGIYKLDATYLEDVLGINPSSIDPREIRIYNNGGGMLPQTAGEYPYDDLEENAIFVSGESDGSFDGGDYVLFFGASPHNWEWSLDYNRYIHFMNSYSDTNYYFMTIGGTGKRIAGIASESGATFTPTNTVNNAYHETDNYNPLKSGRTWLGETFDFTTNRTFSFDVPNLASGTEVDVHVKVSARSDFSHNFTISENGTLYKTVNLPTVTTNVYGSYFYRSNFAMFAIDESALSDNSVDLELVYSKPEAAAVGWLDYIELQYRQRLNLSGLSAYPFSVIDGLAEVHEYNFSGAGTGWKVWDVSNPVEVTEREFSLSGSNLNFGVTIDNRKRFYAFTSGAHKTPASAKSIGFQNLHALEQVDFLIITHPVYMGPAEELASFHREQLGHSVHVVNVLEIYNEYSSGVVDPAGIRNFIKMFYDRSTSYEDQIKYVLLMGDGSYDYKGLTNAQDSWWVPAYQSRKSMRPTESYTSDDFYGFLDDGEGFWGEAAASEGGGTEVRYVVRGDSSINTHNLDVAIGRIPCQTLQEAQNVVEKIKVYASPQSFGDWRNRLILVADHKDSDGTVHISQSDSYTEHIQEADQCINIEKVFLDNYEMVNTANGTRFPTGKAELFRKLEDGSLIVNYTGHGGETGWSNSKILEIPDINGIENGDKLPIYVTATCEFGRWDDPSRQSGAEQVFMRQGNGSIAMFTTVRVVFSGPNYVLNTNFYDYALTFDTLHGRMPTMGEIFVKTKNVSWMGGINNRNFTLMGDPALTLNYPELQCVITQINGTEVVEGVTDSLASLSLVTIEGEIRDDLGTFLPDYDGDLFINVFDKPSRFVTKRKPFSFWWQKNKVFNGQATVEDGRFSFQFVVPIDVSYEDGLGKISLYCQNNELDGGGCNNNIYVGGTGDIVDNDPPQIELYINDETFVDGGMTNPHPLMLARVYDENGINTVGTGIGHELTGVLNEDENAVLLLNDYYTADKNSYQAGTIEYPFENLPTGRHTLSAKVWDVANNSAEDYITFIVSDDATVALGEVLNYPNPFTTNTQFIVEHNQNGKVLDVMVKIYTVSGRMVKSLEANFFADGNIFKDLTWDGLDEWGDPIGKGVYVYQVTLKEADSGEKVSKFEKLVLLR